MFKNQIKHQTKQIGKGGLTMRTKKKFYQKVNLKSKENMIKFLENHFRYDTMSSWNLSTSYANNLKLYKVIPDTLLNKAYEIFEQGDVYHLINDLIEEWDIQNNYQYQVGFNGKSGGYLVMYKGGYKTKIIFKKEDFKKDNGYNGRVYADRYGWKSYNEAEKAKLINKEIKEVFCWSGKAIDDDFEEWDIYDLRERVKLIQSFDKLCDSIVKEFIYHCENYKIEEEEILIPKKIKVLKEV